MRGGIRIAILILIVGALTFAGIALARGGGSSVKPGKGCGDKNHVHYREAECTR
jgi:hypothetical protein